MSFFTTTLVLFILCLQNVLAGAPSKIYGVNLGSWLVLESWMLPQEWLDMGGELNCDCSTCIGSEFNFVKAYPDTADAIFDKHWSTWFTQDDVNILAGAGINTVRIPLGYWIVEPLVNRQTEFYPRGGIKQLKRGLRQLQDAGIMAILDHHAPPGAQSVNQMFAGQCTPTPQFYTDYNYHRALVWTAVMTSLSHLDPDFANVFSIEAVNEPIMDAAQTPGYGDFQQNFVRTVRAIELVLGIPVPGASPITSSLSSSNFTSALTSASKLTPSSSSPSSIANIFTPEVQAALTEAIPILIQMGIELAIPAIFDLHAGSAPFHSIRDPLVTNFMDVNWQSDSPPNPADAAIGPQGYDNHLYYVFGGVADPTPEAYMTSICNLDRVQTDAAVGNSPLWFGEWGLPTQFDATDEFLVDWADAQKLAYAKGAGWIFWNFKVEISDLAGDLAREWSYEEGLRRGYMTQNPAQVHNPHVCDPYIANGTSTS
ncbi:glycoside hydrolase family 5 protein [Punctularia strigosozonata HHB-11173 SS5]|uniref:glycoside hydrolase family 5 protein n=1 Tax=Punctularia strigosozonata (strain HHB-11173) TaxID=741275 RepID=UPI0004417515|nr:glycoside hydrolase family 5 protein [Punctularia strigosozonata HHB-11173 SS5]EIN06302.1 glycoside hydrolase family 5 protein [Punctularia strigosozonata HHB-11173 SS5]